MIELMNNQLTFRFPEVHKKACSIDFQRTCGSRMTTGISPPRPGSFPVEHVDDFADKLPDTWRTHGGVFIPMYQSRGTVDQFLW